MAPTKEQLDKMSLVEMESKLQGSFPGSDVWNIVWPTYDFKKRRADKRETRILFAISAIIALTSLIITLSK